MILTSWKAIAAYLSCGVRTAQRWEMEMALPVRRPGGSSRNIVLAVTEELDEWVKQKPVVEPGVDNLVVRQAQLRRELGELRIRQRQLVAELRGSLLMARQLSRGERPAEVLSKPRQERRSDLHEPICVLTVDDNECQSYAVSRVLMSAGFEVIATHTAREAMNAALNCRPKLALVDIHLPDLNGYELVALFRREPRTEQLPVIFQTSSASIEAAEVMVRTMKARGLIRHPVEPKILVSMVQELTDRSGANYELIV